MKRKILVSSLLSILLSLGVVIGGTFAVFTSEAETNITIGSGKVEVVSNVSLTSAYSRNQKIEVADNKGTFVNGGTVSVDNGLVDLKLLTPGDRAEFTISIENNSNVAAKYRTIVSLVDGNDLFKGLNVTVNGEKYNGETKYAFWADAASGVLEEVKVVIELPYEAKNEYQDLNAKINFQVEAIQGNGDYYNENAILYADNWYSSYADALKAAASDENPEFNVYGYVAAENVAYTKNSKFVGKNETATIDFTGNIFSSGLSSITFENLKIKRSNNIYVGFTHTAMETYNNCEIDGVLFVYGQNAKFENCTFNQTSADAYNVWTYAANVDFVNCDFYSAGKSLLIYKENGTTPLTVNVTECDFFASAPAAGKAAIEIDTSLNPYVVNITNSTSTGFALGNVSGNSLWNHKNGSNLTITVDGTTPEEAPKAATQDDLNTAISSNEEVVVLGKGEFKIPAAAQNKEITFVGAGKDTVVVVSNVSNISSITMENLTIKEDNATYGGYTHVAKASYRNCIINGQFFNYASDVEFINCTFNQESADAYNIWTYGANSVRFVDCDFYSAGKAALVYNEGAIADPSYAYFVNCDFFASSPVEGKAAIEIDSRFNEYIVEIENCTSTGFGLGSVSGNSLWNHKLGNQATITVK